MFGRFTGKQLMLFLNWLTASQFMEWVRLHSESITGRQGYAAGYKRPVELEMLDPTGVY
jgi:hypothetical protein